MENKEINLNKIAVKYLSEELIKFNPEILDAMKEACEQTIDLVSKEVKMETLRLNIGCDELFETDVIDKDSILKLKNSIK